MMPWMRAHGLGRDFLCVILAWPQGSSWTQTRLSDSALFVERDTFRVGHHVSCIGTSRHVSPRRDCVEFPFVRDATSASSAFTCVSYGISALYKLENPARSAVGTCTAARRRSAPERRAPCKRCMCTIPTKPKGPGSANSEVAPVHAKWRRVDRRSSGFGSPGSSRGAPGVTPKDARKTLKACGTSAELWACLLGNASL